MAVITTGSLMQGTVAGLAEHLKTAGKNFPNVYYVLGTPHNILEWNNGSDIAVDSTNGNYYIADADQAGSSWIKLGSTT